MALELSQSKWKVAFSTGPGQKPRRRDLPAGALYGLWKEIAKAKRRFGLPGNAPVVSCYEAGRDGFWIHRWLCHEGIENLVVDSSSIEVSRRRRRPKTDRLDVGKLLAMLIRWAEGEDSVWSVVNPPTAEQEDARQLHRELESLKGEQTAHGNRIKGLLASVGTPLAVDRRLAERLEMATLWDGSPLPENLKQRILREFQRMQLVNQQIRRLEQQRAEAIRQGEGDPACEKVRRLLELRGLGAASSWLFVQEVFAWREIRNRRELASLLGLTPTPYNSGDSRRDQGISKAGNRRVRAMAIEIAWIWLRYQPQSQLSRWYERRFGQGGKRQRRIGIVAMARKLMIAIWKYLRDGEIPEGAEFREGNYTFSYTRSLS
jgi:transposase